MYERRRAREPASLHLVVGDRSSINYTLPMVVGPDGYNPLLEVHLDTVEISSSLNDIRLVTAESCRIHGEMPAPLKWDSERKWSFGVTLRQSVLYLLRDHINMITDLVRDWTSGPPHDYHRFVPMIYQLKFELHHFALNMYANDHNIIDKPLIRDENGMSPVVLFVLWIVTYKLCLCSPPYAQRHPLEHRGDSAFEQVQARYYLHSHYIRSTECIN